MITHSATGTVPTMQDDNGTAGWDAINEALALVHPQQEPRHFGAALPWTLGGNDPLDGISVYWSEHGRPHWHYVTYGLSELFGKQSDDPALSGFGFELTFRLAAGDAASAADTPPSWPLNLLQNIARYVFQTGNAFEAGHHLDANGPIALDHATQLRYLAFVLDPQLAPRDTRNGRLQFLQLVGLTGDEVEAIKRWSTQGVLDVLEPRMPAWITDLERGSLLDDPALAAAVEQGSLRDGSSTGMLLLETLQWRVEDAATTLVLGAGQVPAMCELLALRLRHGRSLVLADGARQWEFLPGPQQSLQGDADSARFTLDPAGLEALLAAIQPRRGRYAVAGSGLLTIEVVPTQLRDAKGDVLREIG